MEENRRKERERKQKYREKQRPKSLLCTPEEVKVKLRKNTIMVTNRLPRKQLKTPTREPSTKIKKRIQSNNTLSPTTSPLKVSKFLWNSLTPKSRRKAKLKLKETDTPAGLSHQFGEELGVNFSNSISSSYERDSIKTKVDFFNRDDISRLCPDKQKVVKNPAKPEEQQQIRYQLGYTKTLFYKFQALENIDCSCETFSRHVPYYVKKAGPSDWGTCLCRTCLNPELKIEKLIQEKLIPSINLEYVIQNDDDYYDLLENIKLLEQKPSNLKINGVE